jgi:hypothetical protein
MRTTLTLADDLARRARRNAARANRPFKAVINDALRLGLEALERGGEARPYKTKPQLMGLRAGFSYDNIGELLAAAEREDFR